MLAQHLPGFLQWLRFEKRFSPHTVTAYGHDITRFSDYLRQSYAELTDIADIRHYHIRSWLAALKEQQDCSASTLNRKISTLSSYYKYLLRQGLAGHNPVRQLHALRLPGRLPVYLKEGETAQLLEEEHFGEGFRGFTDRLICDLLYNTGMRRGELVQLREKDVEWSLHQIRVLGKGNKERLIPLSAALLDDLRAYLEEKRQMKAADADSLLVLESGRPLYAGYVYRVVKRHLGRVTTQEKRSPHVMRHTFATHLLNNGANIQAIKELLGHSSLAATQVYTHNNIGQLKEIHRLNHPREQRLKDDDK